MKIKEDLETQLWNITSNKTLSKFNKYLEETPSEADRTESKQPKRELSMSEQIAEEVGLFKLQPDHEFVEEAKFEQTLQEAILDVKRQISLKADELVGINSNTNKLNQQSKKHMKFLKNRTNYIKENKERLNIRSSIQPDFSNYLTAA